MLTDFAVTTYLSTKATLASGSMCSCRRLWESINVQTLLTAPCRTGVLSGALTRATEEPQLAANQQTALRLACNLCKHESLRSWLNSNSSVVLDRFGPCCSSSNKAVRLAFATLLLNLAVMLGTSGKGDTSTPSQARLAAANCVYMFPITQLKPFKHVGLNTDDGLQVLSALAELLNVTPQEEADTLLRYATFHVQPVA